ncbi:hypothetical protein [Ehrlichia canis]|uniref:hypothetical protein n=1 Tax=Ehrlichia canis TaxID=944 RepID=UPI000C843BA1|nr:hypothetical protein [Ehrlichia canis]AUO54957.1 hypothetical protein C1I72_03720 [Ehrlichia canis]UKC53194.1 hypothetical protein s20019040002_000237 [Ehrlichia canis]UKC54131.1 hypothetical protein s20026770001_000237 [Ehrlichia canis]UKC55067.1 hypothetical protein s21009500007_000237 [Ehrlichia canis]
MLSLFRNITQRLSKPSFMQALDRFNIQKIRNTKYDVCRTGEQAWKDIPRDSILVNRLSTNLTKLIADFNRSNKKPLEGDEHRIILHSMFNSTFNTIANKQVHPLLIDECITMMNQTSLHGSLCTELMRYIGEDIQKRIFPENSILPASKNFDTKIEVISNTELRVEYNENIDFRDIASGNSVCRSTGTLTFNINVDQYNLITYNNPKIKLELPTQISSQLCSPTMVFVRNMFTPLRNSIRRVKSILTRSPFNSTNKYQIKNNDTISTIEYNIPDYTCTSVLLTQHRLRNTIENTKEDITDKEVEESSRHSQKPRAQDHEEQNNKITVSAMVHPVPSTPPITEEINELEDIQKENTEDNINQTSLSALKTDNQHQQDSEADNQNTQDTVTPNTKLNKQKAQLFGSPKTTSRSL